jgi:hypothetical protein
MGLPQLLACLDVKERHGKEDNGEQQHHYILHRKFLSSGLQRTFLSSAASMLRTLPRDSIRKKQGDPVFLHKNDSGLCQLRVSKRFSK